MAINFLNTIQASTVNIGAGVELKESADRADLLQITSATSGWAGIQLRNSSNEGRWSLMTDGSLFGIYDDEGNEWAVKINEDQAVSLYYNNVTRLETKNDGARTWGNHVATGGFLVPYTAGQKKPMINLEGATNYGLWHTEASNDIFSFDFGGVSKHQFFQTGNATFAGDLTVSGGDITLGGTGRIQGVDTVSAGTDAANKAYVDLEIATRTPLNDIRSLGVEAFTNGSNPNITTAQVMDEIDSDGGFDSYSSVFKTSWSYAGNYNLTDAGRFTETAGSSWITWTDNSSDSTRGNVTTLAIAPNTGGSAGKVFIYNNQGGSYSPGWREVWTSTSDGAGSGLDADLLDGQEGSYYLDYANFTNTPTIPQGTVTGSGVNQRLAFWNGTSSLSSDDELTWDGVNLNIGTYAGTGDCELRLFGSTPNNSFSTLKTTNGNLHIDSDNGHTIYLNYYSGGGTSVIIGNGNGGSSNTIFSANGNVSVGGDLTVSGGDITLNGTGRIQGVDTVSASTDAANKDYVDTSLGNYLPVNNPTFTGTLTGPSASITGNTLLGNSNGDYVHVNDRLFVGATDSGNAEFWFGEGTTGDVNYGAHWHWDSGYTHKWFTVNNSSETLMMSYATNDTSKVNWYRDIDIQDNDIVIDTNHGFVNSGAWTRNTTPSGYIEFGPANTSHAHIYTDRPNFYFNKELYVNSMRVYNTGYHPEADKWTTARTLTLTGYATGSVSWDGSGNVSMTTAVAKIKAGGNGPSTENLNSVADSVSVGQLEYRGFNSSSSNKPPTSDNANGVITVGQHAGNYNAQLAFSSNGNMYWRDNPSTGYGSWRTMWDSGNDGSGSGLDADLLDGQQGSYYAPASGGNYWPTSGSWWGANMPGSRARGTADSGGEIVVIKNNPSNGRSSILVDGQFYAGENGGFYSLYSGNNYNNKVGFYGNSSGDFYITTTNVKANGNTMWHAGNDGAGSGLDADLLDGYHASTSRSSANTIPIRDGNGYLNLGWINTTSGNTTSTISDVYVNTNDGYIRKATKSHFRSQLTDGVYLPIAGKAADSELLDGKDHTNFGATLATYGTTAGASGRIRCTAPFNTNSGHMFQVTVSIYSSYTVHNYVVSGYMYNTTNNWYASKVVYSGTGSPDIKVGRDSNGKAYISIANGAYTGVRVHNMTQGYYTSVADTYDPWTITIDAALPNVISPDIYTTWTSGNDGAGSGLDADLLDGQQGSYYATAGSLGNYLLNTTDTFTGTLTLSGNLLLSDQVRIGDDAWIEDFNMANSIRIKGNQNNNQGYIAFGTQTKKLGCNNSSTLQYDGHTVWTAGNDGAGSGLDADTVDGYQATSLLKSDENDAFTGTLTMGTQKALVANNYGRGVYGIYSSTRYQHVWSMGTAYNLADNGSTPGNIYGLAYTHTNVGGQSKPGLSHQLLVMNNGVTKSAIGTGIWTSGNVDIQGDSFMSGYLRVTGDIRGNGQELVLNAGESATYATGQTAENVYANAEAGLIVTSSPDNWSSGWAGRNTTYINNANGDSSFSGKISVQGSNVIEIDQGTSSFNHLHVLSTFGSKLFSSTNYGYVLESSAVSADPVTFRFDNDRYRIYSGSSGEAFTVLANKKVGINNTNPTYQLHVSGNAGFTGQTTHSAGLLTSSSQTRNKISVWSSLSTYTIGMKNGFGYGGLGGNSTGTEYAMSFQMSNTNDRGWWWGDTSHSDVQGAMSLTTQGKLVVATSLSVGAGETTRTAAVRPLEVTGNALIDGRLTIEGPAPIATQPMLELHRSSPVVDYKDLSSAGYFSLKERFLNVSNTVIGYREVAQNPGASGIYHYFDNGASGGSVFHQRQNSFHWKINNTSEKLTLGTNGYIGINDTSPSYQLDVNGSGRFTSTVTATNFILSSDERLKENIKKVCDNRVEVDWKTFELKADKGQKRYGVIAQELEKTNPEFVREGADGFKSVAYIDLLIAKIAELEARLEKLEK